MARTPSGIELPGFSVFTGMQEAFEEIDNILHLSMQGIQQVAHIVPLIKALDAFERAAPDYSEEDAEKKLKLTQARAKLAEDESTRGFPVLHQHAAVAIWGLLEAFVEDLAIALLKLSPALLEQECFAFVKIPLAEFESLEPDERLRKLIREHSRQARSESKQGVAGFEVTLDAVRMAGGVDDETRRSLHELSQVRNVLVHRGGIADRQLLRACPWVTWKPGEKLLLTHDDYSRFRNAVSEYLVELVRRAVQFTGRSREEAESIVPASRHTL